MSKPAHRDTPLIEGPAGALETLLERPEHGDDASVIIVCHPHPAHGGAMTNKVAYTLARAGVLAGLTALRFNFRGVGASAGSYDEGRGELEDVLAVVDWVRTELRPKRLVLGGFSFGSAMVVFASHQRDCDQLLLVAPPVGRILPPDTRVPDALPLTVVQGGQDDLVDPEAVIEWCNAQPPGVQVTLMETADHFFHGHLPALRERLVEALEQGVPE
ncbi:MAG: alpha/beta fold hydrolase [Pseudomonadota bacterium]